jgi:hypothetical protein
LSNSATRRTSAVGLAAAALDDFVLRDVADFVVGGIFILKIQSWFGFRQSDARRANLNQFVVKDRFSS